MISSTLRARRQGVLDVMPRTGGVRMSVRGAEGDAHELDFFKRQDATRVNSRTQGHELVGPNGRKVVKWVLGFVPLSVRSYLVHSGSTVSFLQAFRSSYGRGIQFRLSCFLSKNANCKAAEID